jgi:hypothetical protein
VTAGGGVDDGGELRRARLLYFGRAGMATVGENDNGSDSGGCDAATAGEVKAGMAGGDIF